MVWGVSFALHEEAVTDRRSGHILNADLAEYHVPVNADIPSVEALLIEEQDPYVNALGIKGAGEIGITGTGGAVANAVWHATGVRPRRFPVRIEHLLTPVGSVRRPAPPGDLREPRNRHGMPSPEGERLSLAIKAHDRERASPCG
jgi:CO/xanthine dehydrogenase Mo-binding subunit